MEALIKLVVLIVTVAIGYFWGRHNEKKHLRQLAEEEQALEDVLVFATRYPPVKSYPTTPILVSGSAVVGSDYFRYFVSGLRKLVGGHYRAYEQLTDRARRQAIVRMKQAAKDAGASTIFNVRIQSANIASGQREQLPAIEVLAYGTAFLKPSNAHLAHWDYSRRDTNTARYEPPFDLLKHHFSRNWLIGGGLMLVYAMGEMIIDPRLDVQWRYASGAPWDVFALIGLIASAMIAWRGHRAKLPISAGIGLTFVSTLLMCFALYFATLRLNHALVGTIEPQAFEVLKDGNLQDKKHLYPPLDMDGPPGYWQSQPPGTEVQVTYFCGPLGLCQFDTQPNRKRYRIYLNGQEQSEHNKQKKS